MRFKTLKAEHRFSDLGELLQKIVIEMDEYAQEKYGIQLTFTETVTTLEEDKAVNRLSDTHRTRRAVDIRVEDLPESLIAELCAVFRKKYGKHGAIASAMPQLIVYKPHGTGPHLHVQVSRKYSLKEIAYG
jgi:hypothetical protein